MKLSIRGASLFFCLAIVFFASAAQAQSASVLAPAASAFLSVTGEVARPLKLSPEDLAKLPRHTVKVKDDTGTESTFEGAALNDVLQLAGVPSGERLRDGYLTLYLIVEATNGYRALFSLAELDPKFKEQVIILADRRDGRPLSATEGPLRIVVPDEKSQVRWVPRVSTLMIRFP